MFGIMIDTSNFMTKTGVRTFRGCRIPAQKRCGCLTRVKNCSVRMQRQNTRPRRMLSVRRDHHKRFFCNLSLYRRGLPNPTIIGAQAANELLNIKEH